MTLDAGLALDLLAAAVRRSGPEHQPRRDRGDAGIIETVFRALPFPDAQVRRWRGCDIREAWLRGELPPATTVGAVAVLRRAQRAETRGDTWGEALDGAHAAVRSILALTPSSLTTREIAGIRRSCRSNCGLSIDAFLTVVDGRVAHSSVLSRTDVTSADLRSLT
jgi:hypothetical protein